MERPIIHGTRTYEPNMSAVEYHDQTRGMIASLERREVARTGNIPTARKRLARRLGTMPGTLESFARNRLKRADAYLRARVEALLVIELQTEIAALTHELEIVRARGAHPACQSISEIEAALATARALMGVK